MCVRVCVCACVYVCVCACVHVHVCVCVCLYAHITEGSGWLLSWNGEKRSSRRGGRCFLSALFFRRNLHPPNHPAHQPTHTSYTQAHTGTHSHTQAHTDTHRHTQHTDTHRTHTWHLFLLITSSIFGNVGIGSLFFLLSAIDFKKIRVHTYMHIHMRRWHWRTTNTTQLRATNSTQ